MDSIPAPAPTQQHGEPINDQVRLLTSIEQRLAANEQAQKQIIQKLASLETIQKDVYKEETEVTDVILTDVDIPFWSLVTLIIKWALAAIPATLVIGAILGVIYLFFGILFAGCGPVIH